MNDGVQGGSPIFKHTFNFMKKYGHEPQEVRLQVAFGQGKDAFWTNCFPSVLVERFSGDIKKFGKVLKIIKWTMPVLGLVPIRVMLRLFFFSKDFGDKMVYPLIALFLGTGTMLSPARFVLTLLTRIYPGNQTANVACAILERLFDDPNMKLWDYDPETLLPNLPQMVTFPHLGNFYSEWAKDLRSKGVDIQTSTEVVCVKSRSSKGVVLETAPFDQDKGMTDPKGGDERGGRTGPVSETKTYDNMVMCVLADDAKTLLGKTATWREKFVLGGAYFFDDITITHSDSDYFAENFETKFNPEFCAKPKNEAQEKQIAFSKDQGTGQDGEPGGYRPMYYTHSYKENMAKIEMAFDCTNYQHQFRQTDPNDASTAYHAKAQQPYDHHVFQSIFLDKENSKLWTIDGIDTDKIILRKWWHQLGHRWQHYVRVVPGMMFINGKNSTLFAGSWTLVNMHEMACVSGIAAAWRLGAEYEVFDEFAENLLQKYLLLSHGKVYKSKGGEKKKN